MKVFAHYLGNDKNWNLSKDGFQYRWRTILQFGNSWDVIGSVVMKNPGSAKPLQRNLSETELKALAQFDNSDIPWYQFTSDNTMYNIERLFIARYNGKPLDGVIQIFNLFNIRNADLDVAIKSSTIATESILSTLEDDIDAMRQHMCPIYIGWGALGADQRFIDKASKIFQFVRCEMKQNYLFPNFDDNRFYHPQYLVGRGKNRLTSKTILKAFCKNSNRIESNELQVNSNPIPQFSEIIDCVKAVTIESKWYEGKRYEFYPGLQATFDNTTINIRFKSRKDRGFLIENYQSTQEKEIVDVLTKKFGYIGPENVWIGRKEYNVFGNSSSDIASRIKEDFDKIIICLNEKEIILC